MGLTKDIRFAVRLLRKDQSHMIAEFREFSGLTPHELAKGEWFHPLIERARHTGAGTRSQS